MFSISRIAHIRSVVGKIENWEKELLDKHKDDIGRACGVVSSKQVDQTRARIWLQAASSVGSPYSEHAKVVLSALSFLDNIGDSLRIEMPEYRLLLLYLPDVKEACSNIAGRQSSVSQARIWLQVGMITNPDWKDEGGFIDSALLFASDDLPAYTKDEAIYLATRVKGKATLKTNSGFGSVSVPLAMCSAAGDPDGTRSLRCLVRTLLSGSLKRNGHTVIHRSFFRSTLREVQLLPLIGKYLGKADEKEAGTECNEQEHIDSLLDLSRLLYLDVSPLEELTVSVKTDNHLIGLLPLLLSRTPVKRLILAGSGACDIDLSLLRDIDTSSLYHISLRDCTTPSFPFLAKWDLPCLQELELGSESLSLPVYGIESLEGLTMRNTASLKSLVVRCPDLIDVSAVYDCDFSSIEALDFGQCEHLSDISPFCGVKGLSPVRLNFEQTAIEDISRLCHIDLSRLRYLNLSDTKVSNLSPLWQIKDEGIEVNISYTPEAEKMQKNGMDPPLIVGKVRVVWSTYGRW